MPSLAAISACLSLMLGVDALAAGASAPAKDPADSVQDSAKATASPASKPKVTYKGSLSKEEIERVLRTVKQPIKNCYDRIVVRNQTIRGKVTMRFVINGTGAVDFVEVKSNDTGSKALGDCISRILAPLRFPAPRGGGKVLVTYPYVFSLYDVDTTFWDWVFSGCA